MPISANDPTLKTTPERINKHLRSPTEFNDPSITNGKMSPPTAVPEKITDAAMLY